MRAGSAILRSTLLGSFDANWTADVMLDRNRLIKDVPLVNPQFNEVGTSSVQVTGSVDVVYQGDFAESVAPSRIGDALSPFGSQLWVYVNVTAGDGFTERVPYGQFLISETPSIRTSKYSFQGAVASKGDVISLNLKDLLYGVQRDRFDVPSTAPSLASVWTEVQRLTQLPVTRTVTDGAITTAVAYQDDKLQAVYDLATILDAVVYMTADGTVGMRPNVWPAVVDTLSYGDGGTLLAVDRGMANDTVYNKVVVRTSASDNTAILATSEVGSGPLRTSNADGSLSPYRRVPYFYSSEYITTTAQAQAYADQQLPRVSSLRSVTVQLTEAFNPLREVGDVLTINRLGETYTARVSGISRSGIDAQTTTVVVNP